MHGAMPLGAIRADEAAGATVRIEKPILTPAAAGGGRSKRLPQGQNVHRRPRAPDVSALNVRKKAGCVAPEAQAITPTNPWAAGQRNVSRAVALSLMELPHEAAGRVAVAGVK